jgi:site-specific DNA-methyltransferase (adenine-specific)
MENIQKAPRNRTIVLTENDRKQFQQRLKTINKGVSLADIIDSTLWQDSFEVIDLLPDKSIDLLIADPPYNLTKNFNGNTFSEMNNENYEMYLDAWMAKLPRILKKNASIYICGDWKSSSAIYEIASRYFKVKNRITWEREKGRGAKTNWKNNSEDIWFCTVSDDYTFNVESVMVKRKVIAPYKENAQPKDWVETEEGKFRMTHPSNIWTDLTVPFWSMPENTDHPTQKPEKLIAKLILASSNPNDIVFDPFVGSGTTSVVAKKLQRHFIGSEQNEEYCLLAEKRLEMVNSNPTIQGYSEGVFWERNSLNEQKNVPKSNEYDKADIQLFNFGSNI